MRMMRRNICLAIGGIVLLSGASCSPRSAAPPPSPAPRVSHLPNWESKASGFPKTFVDAASFLLAHGMGDPRGGRYSTALVADGSEKRTAVGWIFAAAPGMTGRFVAVDGLTYIPLDGGTPRDLTKDAADVGYQPVRNKVNDLQSDTAIALVLIDGHADLARKMMPWRTPSPVAQDFMRMAEPFLTGWWDQILSAHVRGDDSLAFHKAVALQKFRDDYERQATRVLGEAWVRQMGRLSMGGNGKPETFRFLDSIDAMVQDSARRITQPKHKPLSLASLPKTTSPTEIADMIGHLDDLQVKPGQKPGTLDWTGTPLYEALVGQGKAALDPLAQTMDEDERLTRTLAPFTDPSKAQVLTVKQVARMAIGEILHWPGLTKPSGAPASSQEVRQFIRQNGLGSLPGDWLAVLADENASPEQWLRSAEQLMSDSRTGVVDYGSIVGGPRAHAGIPISQSPRLKAEPLRNRINPSLSDLLKTRALQLVNDANSPIPFASRIETALKLTMLLDAWDSSAALPVAQKVTETGMTPPDDSLRDYDIDLVKVLQIRLNLGDKTALRQYGQWLASIPTDLMLSTGIRCFGLLSENAFLPDVRTLADRLFVVPRAPLSLPRLLAEYPDGGLVEAFAVSPLLQLGSMHQAVQEMLDLKAQIGYVTLESHTRAKVVVGDYVKHWDFTLSKTDTWKTGERREYRACDFMASLMAQLDGAPKFEPQWTVPQRDKAILAISAFLDRNESHLGDLVPANDRWN